MRAAPVRRLAAAAFFVTSASLAAAAPPSARPADPRTLTGTVTDADGAPVAGAVVRLQSSPAATDPLAPPTEADAAGRFSLTCADRPSRPGLFVTHPDGEAAGFVAVGPGGDAPSNRPWPSVAVTLRPGTAVNVAVTDADGAPVAGATAEALIRNGYVSAATAETGADGTVRMFVPAGSERITVLAMKDGTGLDATNIELLDEVPGDAAPGDGAPGDGAPGDGLSEEEAPEATASLRLGGAFAMTLTARDLRGEPVPGVVMSPLKIDRTPWPAIPLGSGRYSLINLQGARSLERTTGEDGTATFAYLPNDLTGYASFEATSDMHHAPRLPGIQANAPRTELTVWMVPRVTLSGRVTDAAGAPAAGVRVHLEGDGASNAHWSNVTTDADGRWSDRAPAGQAHVVSVEAEDRTAAPRVVVVPGLVRSGVALTDPDAPKTAPGGVETVEPVTDVDFTLGPGAPVTGTVRNADDDGGPGEPAAGATVFLSQDLDAVRVPGITAKREGSNPGAGWVRPRYFLRRTTDADGRYAVRLTPGEWSIWAAYGADETITIPPAPSGAAPSSSAPPQTLDLLIPAREKPSEVTVTVVDAAGEPVPGAIVEGAYPRATPYYFPFAPTGPDGTLTARRTGGRLLLCATAPDATAFAWAELNADDDTVTMRLGPTGAIRGRLTTADGSPIMGAKLRAALQVPVSDDGTEFTRLFGGSATAGPDGRFLIAGLPTGRELTVSVTHPTNRRSLSLHPVTPEPGEAALTGVLRVDDSEGFPKWKDLRPRLSPTFVGSLPERVRSAFTRRPRADERLPALAAAAALRNKGVLVILADPADPATTGLWQLFAARENLRDAAGRGFVTIYRPIGLPVGPDPRAEWNWDRAPQISPDAPGPIIALVVPANGSTPAEGNDANVTVRAAVSLAGLSPNAAAATAGAFLRTWGPDAEAGDEPAEEPVDK